MLSIFGAVSAQTAATMKNFEKNKENYIGRPVSDLLKDLPMQIKSFIIIPNYDNPNYGNEFRFSSHFTGETSTLIRANNRPLFLVYVRFSPQIKFPLSGFMNEYKGQDIYREHYAEFEQYRIVDISVSTFPR